MKFYVALLVALVVVIAGGLGVHTLIKSGELRVENKNLKQAAKTKDKETKNANANATISKQTEAARATDKAKGAKALKEIEDAAANSGGARPCFTPDELRRYNDPLGDTAPAGGRGLSGGVPDASAGGVDGRHAVAAGEQRGAGAGDAGVRAPSQRARRAGPAAPEVSIVQQRLKEFFPEEEAK